MSDEEKQTILDDLRIVKRFLGWLSAGVGALLLGGIWMLITDHFTLASVKEQITELRPQVTEMWWAYYQKKQEHQ